MRGEFFFLLSRVLVVACRLVVLVLVGQGGASHGGISGFEGGARVTSGPWRSAGAEAGLRWWEDEDDRRCE